jgi:hypothetical protein
VNLWHAYLEWKTPPADADKGWFQQRGYALERIIGTMLDSQGLRPRLSYRIQGEQIDGSFRVERQYFLLEAKWHSKPKSASDIYDLQGKVEGKLRGTLGVFISLSGFTEKTPETLVRGKALTVILFDQDDFEAALSPDIGFLHILDAKLRAAAEQGVAFFPFRSIELQRTRHKPKVIKEETLSTGDGHRLLTIVCEGTLDNDIIVALADRLAKERRLKRDVKVVVANGKVMAPRIANMFARQDVLVVIDSDGDLALTNKILAAELSVKALLSIPHPGIEAWLGTTHGEFRKRLDREVRRGIKPYEVIHQLVFQLELDRLRREQESFAVLFDALTN